MWQHNTGSLVAVVWLGNGIDKTLSNYNKPIIVAEGLIIKKKMRDNDVQEKQQPPVDALMQNVDYSDTFH